MKPVEPIDTVDLFPPLHNALLTLLRNLSDEDWHKPTVARLWTVKDIVAHLLDDDQVAVQCCACESHVARALLHDDGTVDDAGAARAFGNRQHVAALEHGHVAAAVEERVDHADRRATDLQRIAPDPEGPAPHACTWN